MDQFALVYNHWGWQSVANVSRASEPTEVGSAHPRNYPGCPDLQILCWEMENVTHTLERKMSDGECDSYVGYR